LSNFPAPAIGQMINISSYFTSLEQLSGPSDSLHFTSLEQLSRPSDRSDD
jgi:hypothetical protein